MAIIFEPTVKADALDVDDIQSVIDYIKLDIASVEHVFEDKIEEGNRNYDFYFGRQWTQEEIVAHEQQKRIPFVFNEIKHKVDHLVGVQMQTRLDVKAVGREPSDEQGALLLTHLLKWVQQVNDLEYTETEVFKDGIIAKVGWAAVYWENDDVLNGYPKVEIVPYNEMYYDGNALKPDLSDARWVARRTYITRQDAKEKYPWLEDELNSGTVLHSRTSAFENIPISRQKAIGLSGYNSNSSQDRELLEEITHYESILVNQYIVVNDLIGTIEHFDSKKEATDYYDGLVDAYSDAGTSILNNDGEPRVLFMTATKTQQLQTVIVGDLLASRELTILPISPYVAFFPYFSHGDYQAFVDVLISPQVLVNRSFSQWDYLLGASHKNVLTVMKSLLLKGWDHEDVRREVSKTAPVIPVVSHAALSSMPNNPVNPQIFQNIEFGITRMNDYSGGKNAMGLQENAAESGRAVIARAEQGGVSKLPLFDALRRWRMLITQRLVWYIQNFMSPKQIMRIIGDDKDVQYINLDVSVLNTLEEIKIDIVVDEAIKSETMKERNFQQILQFAQVAQLPIEISMPMYLEYSSIPETKKEEIRSQLEFYKTYMSQQAESQKQQLMQQQVQDSLAKRQLKDSLQYGEQIAKSDEDIKRQEKELQSRMKSLQQMKEKALQEQQKTNAMQQMQQQLQSQQNQEGKITIP